MPKSPTTSSKERMPESLATDSIGDQEVQMDRRWKTRRIEDSPASSNEPEEAAATETEIGTDTDSPGTGERPKFNPPRRRKQRRRQIDPTTCERDYNDEEIRFMRAMDDYKRDSGRMFPTCSEILEVVRSLGYIKPSEEELQILESIQEVEDELAEATNPAETSDSEEFDNVDA